MVFFSLKQLRISNEGVIINMSETIRIVTYGNVNSTNIDVREGNSKSLDISGMPFLEFATEASTNSTNSAESKGIGEFEVKVETLEAEMAHLIDVVERLLIKAENKSNSEIALDEIELLVEINGEGKISLLGNGAQAGGKGAIKLKFKRQLK